MKKAMLRSSWVVGGLLFPVLAVAATIALTSQAPRRSADASDIGAGVVVAAGGAVIYMMNPDGGIDAVSSASGELLWSSREGARPLALLGDQLIAQGPPAKRPGVLDLVLLGGADGERRQILPIELPEGIWGAIDQGVNTTFEVRVVVLRGEPYVLWDHIRRYAKGIAPEPGEELEQRATGASRLDLLAGRAVAVDPATLTLEPTLPATARQATQRWADSGELSTAPALAGEVIAATRALDERIVLERWNRMGVPLPGVELFSRPYVLEIRSVDGRHLLVTERVAPGDREEYGWSVFDLESGRPLGEIPNHRSQAWYVVHDSTLIYVALPEGRRVGGELVAEPKMLRAVQVDGGGMIWERPLRDTSFRGRSPE